MTAKTTYQEAADFFTAIVGRIQPEQWEAPGLGEWTVRELVGHTLRAMLTIEQYANAAGPPRVEIGSSVDYLRIAMRTPNINEQVAERGHRAGRELGDDPAATVKEVNDRVRQLVARLPDDKPMAVPFGAIRLADYLPARTFELTVHTLDIQQATGIEAAPPSEPIRTVLHLLADLAADTPHARTLALLATGRDVWQGPFSVLG